MTTSAERSRILAAVMLGGVLAASCIQIEDASDKKAKAIADSAGGVVINRSPRIPASPVAAKNVGPDSIVRVHGGPQWTAAERAELQSDTAHGITEIDPPIVRLPELPAPTMGSAPASGTSSGATSSGTTSAAASSAGSAASGAGLGPLIVPVRGIEPAQLRDTYDEMRGGNTRTHEALDIPAPRG